MGLQENKADSYKENRWSLFGGGADGGSLQIYKRVHEDICYAISLHSPTPLNQDCFC